ncbi:MAG TPA: hypothetical protein VJK53_02735 [Candidatus Paceibacterota bacterium]
MQIGSDQPSFSFQFKEGKETGTYLKTSDRGIEPLILSRSFHGMKDGYWEIAEEFRLYFNLYEDRRNNKFIRVDDNGDDEDAVLILDKEIKIKTRLIREFIAAKKMHLVLFFDINRFSDKTIEELGIKEYHDHKKGENFIYSIGARNWDRMSDETVKAQGFLMGKKFIAGQKDFKPSMFDRGNKQFADFVIGIDDDGNEKLHTCDEEKLANYFGKNKGSPYYTTPIFFKKDVLTKYYSQPDKYSVEDGYLRCGGLWGLRMDTNHPNSVMVFLGDLGHLAYTEQLHWRSLNLSSGKMSHVAFARSFEGQFADPEKSDLFFKYRFETFQRSWEKKFGWPLFRPLSKEDAHHLKTLHLPLTNEQKEFDEQVLSLVKVLIDSLNEGQLSRGLVLPKNSKGIDKLEAFLKSKNAKFKGMIEFLRSLQDLRSAGVAHLKGSKYKELKVEFGIGAKDLPEIFDDILMRSIWTLNTLENHFVQKLERKGREITEV